MTANVTKLPIYGHLFVSKPARLKEALHDLTVTTLFSLFPIWLYPIFTWSFVAQNDSLWELVRQTVAEGEFFLYSAAMVGPLIYAITKRYSDNEIDRDGEVAESGAVKGFFRRQYEFPYGPLFTYLSVIICVLAAICFGALKASDSLSIDALLNDENLFWFSVIMYLFTLSCFYCVTVYRLNLDNVTADFGDDERDLAEQWKNQDD